MTKVQRFSLLAIAIFVSACAAGLTVSKRFVDDPEIVSGWETYAWNVPGEPASPTVAAAEEQVRQEIGARLAALGYRETSEAQADFLVRYAIYSHWGLEQMSQREIDAIMEQSIMTGEAVDELDYTNREKGEGALYLFFSRPDNTTVWEGRVETPLDYRGQGLKKLPIVVKQLLADFPQR